ncbi:hypothetical protein [Nocardioides acrostichi]|uniref:Uncharacterized protein n=1 Tax=Nocardioides acrostichi TaxID=2784339 RepID=A0A930UXY8_9ACTN|nr:hypothetical protein [Nocardioides acrostichi]MBF4160142.1 hypothetical protein [Nocardioides acrostichi]
MHVTDAAGPARVASRVARGVAATLTLGVAGLGTAVLLAGPAAADVPSGWSDPSAVHPLHVLLVLIGIPALVAVVLVALVYGPPLARGERVAPGAPPVENQWLGGPRGAAGELGSSSDDADTSTTGGGSGGW